MSEMSFMPGTLCTIASLIEALNEPRNRSLFNPPSRIPLTTPNGEPRGGLVWDSQAMTYRYTVEGGRHA